MNINWIDIVFVIILLRTTYMGYSRGLVSEVFKTLGAISAFSILIKNGYEILGEFIVEHSLIPPPASSFMGFGIVVAANLFIFHILGWTTTNIMKIEFISIAERIAGVLAGAVRGLIFIFLIIIAANIAGGDYLKGSIYKKSFSGHYLEVPFKTASSLAEKLWELFLKVS